MKEFIINKSGSKEYIYSQVIKQIQSLIEGEPDLTANIANIVSVLKDTFDYYLWIGFYFTDKSKSELVLGPFQGKPACTRIGFGKGVCGKAFETKETIIVEDVEKFPGHIYCDSASKSEIVVPVIKDGGVIAVLDADSGKLSAFDETDKFFLEELIKKIIHIF